MTSTLKQQQQGSPGSPAARALVTLPTHVIWTKEEGSTAALQEKFFTNRRATPPPPRQAAGRTTPPQSLLPLAAGGQPEHPLAAPDSVGESFDPGQRIFRLERNLRFLKSQHQQMLSALHDEIEKLKCRNKELQFQLIIGEPLTTQELISPDALDSSQSTIFSTIPAEYKTIHQSIATQTDAAPSVTTAKTFGHLTNAEDELGKLRLALEDAENRNACLGTLIAQLKRSHVRLKSTASLANQRLALNANVRHHPETNPAPIIAHAKKLEEYEELVRSLRRENREQKQELTYVRSCLDQRPAHGRLSLTGVGNRLPADPQRLPRLTEPSGSTKTIQARKTTELPHIHPRSCGSLVSRVERPRSICDPTSDPAVATRKSGWTGDPDTVDDRSQRVTQHEPPNTNHHHHHQRHHRRSKSRPSRDQPHDHGQRF